MPKFKVGDRVVVEYNPLAGGGTFHGTVWHRGGDGEIVRGPDNQGDYWVKPVNGTMLSGDNEAGFVWGKSMRLATEADDTDEMRPGYYGGAEDDVAEAGGAVDVVNHPPHYGGFSNGAEVIDITENLTFNGGNAVKYLARSTREDGNNKGNVLEDLRKSLWYVTREIERVEREQDLP